MSATFSFILYSSMLLKNEKIKIYNTVILLVILYEYGTWPPALKEVHGFSVFENRVTRKTFVSKRIEVTVHWSK
jgi:hypothetical protein